MDFRDQSPSLLNLNQFEHDGLTPLATLDLSGVPTPICFSSFVPTKTEVNFTDSFLPESPLIRLYPASFPLQESTDEH